MTTLKRLLWFDAVAAFTAAVVMLVFGNLLAPRFGVTPGLLTFLAIANASYGAFAFSLARRAQPPMHVVTWLVRANAFWFFVCLGLVLHVRPEATWLGQAYLIAEGIFVGALALIESRVSARERAQARRPDRSS